MYCQLPDLQGRTGQYVDAYTAKADAAHKNSKILLFGAERKRRRWPHDYDGCPLGGKRQPPYQTRHLREYAARSQQKVIINNDNADTRLLFESCKLQAKRVCNPIVDWSDYDVWSYIHAERIPINPLYSCGFHRVGCVGCPMAGRRMRLFEFGRYPTYQRAYIRAFERMLEERVARGKLDSTWRAGTTGEDIFRWWMQDRNIEGQMKIEGFDG